MNSQHEGLNFYFGKVLHGYLFSLFLYAKYNFRFSV